MFDKMAFRGIQCSQKYLNKNLGSQVIRRKQKKNQIICYAIQDKISDDMYDIYRFWFWIRKRPISYN